MAKLIIPPGADVPGIVRDLMKNIAPDADESVICQVIFLARQLVFLCANAQANAIAAKVFGSMFQGMLVRDCDEKPQTGAKFAG